MDRKTFGIALRKARMAKNLTQTHIGSMAQRTSRLKMPQNYWTHWEWKLQFRTSPPDRQQKQQPLNHTKSRKTNRKDLTT